jgi:hypothetical protein
MHDALLFLLRSPVDRVRRAAGEGLALLATKMGTVYQAQLLQQLVECLRGGPNPYAGGSDGDISGGGKASGLGRKGGLGGSLSASSSLGDGGSTDAELLCTGAVFALACLKRSAPAVREKGGGGARLPYFL